ncbi:hypothetical protein BDU57DRAFT_439779 [Ampelomyces quisqualis]|uniref:Uncharacterized protein n=1 Tax=Ampelomyces quisqualis TaxID=50730 RepID=A0A6A5QZ59_AMPQU|nr:hypothetical protein BDU57DRAFT_439779 [Ampelomyces quisqualis]
MQRTPSPSRRVHTPPAPVHGFADSYEPYSPRRSTRVAAQRDIHLHPAPKHTSPRSRRDVTPTASSKRKATARISHFTLSPPSSPVTSPQHRSPRTMRRAHFEAGPPDSESDRPAPTPARRFPSTMTQGMLPTPSETPRKRPLQSEASLKSTARVLFPSRPATIDEVVPTPRKSRKSKNLYGLESFTNASEESSQKIQIFTDSKERIPEHDDEEDNPFVVKKGKGKARATPQKSKKLDARSQRMQEATARDEGIVYLFRGRKILRKFQDAPRSDGEHVSEDGEPLPVEERMLHRQVGHEAHRPLTRSAMKPRLLFQEEIKERNRQNGQDDDDEEAETEIEAHVQTPSKRKGKAVAPMPQPSLEVTPPPTVRKPKRGMFIQVHTLSDVVVNVCAEISFDSWSRVKSAHSSGGSMRGSKKRGGEPLEREADKRARSEKSTSSMSLDSSF